MNPTLPVLHNEHSGSFILSEYNSSKILFLDHQSILQGGFAHVPMNIFSNIIFHTHPKRAMDHYTLETGWPSITDFTTAAHGRNIVMLNMVFSVEGLYIYRITDTFKMFLSAQSINDQKDIINNIYVPHISIFEKKTFPSNDINTYLQAINSTPLIIGNMNILPLQVRFIPKNFFETGDKISQVSLTQIFS